MKYKNTTLATFQTRLNRFTAEVEVDGRTELVHVKNTGRIREFLLPGALVSLALSDNPNRKTKYDLIAVFSDKLGWVNIDSQANNLVMGEWLRQQDFDLVKPEYKFGNSRVDFYLEKGNRRILLEVKGCTEEKDGIGYFPDAPTERGVKHLHELAGAVKEGYECFIAYVIGMPGISEVRPNDEVMPEFGIALEEAKRAGVQVLCFPCQVTENSYEIYSTEHVF